MNKLHLYEEDIKDLSILEMSPFEALETLHIRDRLFEEYNNLDQKERNSLLECDKILLDNADKVYKYIDKIYDWDKSEKPFFRWWWHLDKLVKGNLKFDLDNDKIEYEYRNEYFIKSYTPNKDSKTKGNFSFRLSEKDKFTITFSYKVA